MTNQAVDSILICPYCGSRNRVPDMVGIKLCGACERRLDSNPGKPDRAGVGGLFLSVLIVGFVVFATYQLTNGDWGDWVTRQQSPAPVAEKMADLKTSNEIRLNYEPPRIIFEEKTNKNCPKVKASQNFLRNP